MYEKVTQMNQKRKNIQVTDVTVTRRTILTITKNEKRMNNTRKNMSSKQGYALSVSNLQQAGAPNEDIVQNHLT